MSASSKPFSVTKIHLRPSLTLLDLVFFGIGSTVGVGIFVLTGITAATITGPAVVLSFILGGLTSFFLALVYAELASNLSGTGGAYHYALVTLGNFWGCAVGWVLLLEYLVAVSYLSQVWSQYLVTVCHAIGWSIPKVLQHGWGSGGIINLPAVIILLYLSFLLFIGTRLSARFNLLLVLIKLFSIFAFIWVALGHIQVENWKNFMPFGWGGMVQGAALLFTAFLGFDILALASADVHHPRRNLPLGILITLSTVVILYILVSALLTGIAPYASLNSSSAIIDVLIRLHLRWIATFIDSGAIISITTALFGFYFALTRIVYALSKNNFFPSSISHIHPKQGTPYLSIVISVIIAFLLLEFLEWQAVPIATSVEVVNLSALVAYICVCVCAIKFRKLNNNSELNFRLPWHPIIPLLGIGTSLYLMDNLPLIAWISFLVWIGIGALWYIFFIKNMPAKYSATG